ncbi:MAG: ABC transporter permease subunit [Gammaproteobacteria bacterium]
MSVIAHIAVNELRRLFKSPLAWIILAIVQFLVAIFFYLLLSQFMGAANSGHGLTATVVAGILQISGIILLLVSPLLTMRLFSEEYRIGTIKLLLSSPVSITELVLGKYIGIIVFYLSILVMIALMPISLMAGTELDLGQLLSGLLGLTLLVSAFAAIGLFISTLTTQPSVAAISTFGVLFVLWIINAAGNSASEQMAQVFSYLSLLRHFDNLLDGLFNSVDVIYYLLVSISFIILSIWRLDAQHIHN